MKELLENVKKESEAEYLRAAQKFGYVNHSPHESYAILKEEVDETSDSFWSLRNEMEEYWEKVKRDDYNAQLGCLTSIELHALNVASEAIQVAAMANKAFVTIEQKLKKGEAQ